MKRNEFQWVQLHDMEIKICSKLLAISPALVRPVLYADITGMSVLPVDSYNPKHKHPFTHPKKPVHQRRFIDPTTGKHHTYTYSDTFTAAHNVLASTARDLHQHLTAVTVTLNDETCLAIRNHQRGPAACLAQRLKDAGWSVPTLLVIEKSHNAANVDTSIKVYQTRLHAHLLTLTTVDVKDDDERGETSLRRILKHYATDDNNAVEVKTAYIAKRRYTDFDELEEEQFGEMPSVEGLSITGHWLNTWKQTNSRGEVDVCRRIPVNQGWADYLSKDLDDRIENIGSRATQNFALMNGLQKTVSEYKQLKYTQRRAFKDIVKAICHKETSMTETFLEEHPDSRTTARSASEASATDGQKSVSITGYLTKAYDYSRKVLLTVGKSLRLKLHQFTFT